MAIYSYIVRVSDINYGQHLAHDKLISLVHDARTRYLSDYTQSENNFFGAGLILRQINAKYINQAFLHDEINISVQTCDICDRKLNMEYEVKSKDNGKLIAKANTEMVYFDYENNCLTQLDRTLIANTLKV